MPDNILSLHLPPRLGPSPRHNPPSPVALVSAGRSLALYDDITAWSGASRSNMRASVTWTLSVPRWTHHRSHDLSCQSVRRGPDESRRWAGASVPVMTHPSLAEAFVGL
ncbi:unnamed protein product [Lota lota]